MQMAIEKLSLRPFCVYIMMDRPSVMEYQSVKNACSVGELLNTYKVYNEQIIPEYIGRPNSLPEQSLFLTGDRRNRAISYAINDGCDSFVFIDGDCIPQEDLIKSHSEVHKHNFPVLTCGRRREEKHGYKDQREIVPNLKQYNLFKLPDPQVINSFYLLKTSAITWSCNMGLNLQCVKMLQLANQKYYGSPDVFHTNFLGTWGGEDGFIGIQSYLLGAKILLLSDIKSGIKHIEHDRPADKYSGDAFTIYLDNQIELFKMLLSNSPISINFLVGPQSYQHGYE
jgi:hypothetical protein